MNIKAKRRYERKRNRREVLGMIGAGALGLQPVHAAREIRITLGTVAQDGSVWHDALADMRQRWLEITAGRVDVRILPGGQVGGESEMVRKLRRGTLDAAALSVGLSRLDKGVSALSVPMMLADYDELDYVRERISAQLEKRIEAQRVKVLNWSDAGWVRFFATKPARGLDDIRKLKLFTSAGDPDTEKLFRRLDFQVVPLDVTDMLTSLQTGLIEAIDVPPLFALLDGSFKEADHMIDLDWAPLIAATVISERGWRKIPAAFHDELIEAARASGAALREEIRRQDVSAVAAMQKRGLQVVTLSEQEKQQWLTEVEDAYPTLRGTLAPADVFDEVLRLRDEYRLR